MIKLPAEWHIKELDFIDSTNEEAKRILEAGNKKNVILAKYQTKGRGTRGKDWYSPEGNLFLTFIIEIDKDQSLGHIGFLTCLAADQTLQVLSDCEDIKFKWPNDIFLQGAKLGGILIEPFPKTGNLIVGLGLNLVTHPEEGIMYPATDINHACNTIIKPHDFMNAFLMRFKSIVQDYQEHGFEDVRVAWLKKAIGLGQVIKLKHGEDQLISGIFVDVDDQGHMILSKEEEGSEYVKIAAGTTHYQIVE